MCIVIHRHSSSSIVIKEGTATTVQDRVLHSFTVPFDLSHHSLRAPLLQKPLRHNPFLTPLSQRFPRVKCFRIGFAGREQVVPEKGFAAFGVHGDVDVWVAEMGGAAVFAGTSGVTGSGSGA